MECRACGASARELPEGTEWRICRCSSAYCQWCLDEGCVDCPAIAFWYGLDDDDAAAAWESPRHGPQAGGEPGGGSEAQLQEPTTSLDEVTNFISPQAAHDRRLDLLGRNRQPWWTDVRSRARPRSAMLRDGRHPRRERNGIGTATFTTANVNCAERLMQELKWGQCFRQSDYVLIQELRARGDAVGRITNDCAELGWDAICSEAYIKVQKPGGGTAVLARRDGLKPLAEEDGAHLGRITLAIADACRSAVVGSCYGISGALVCDQLCLWRRLAVRLTALGRPFVIGGDWQVDPDDPEFIRFAESLGAAVCHPGAITNTHANTRIDFFLVSNGVVARRLGRQGGLRMRVLPARRGKAHAQLCHGK